MTYDNITGKFSFISEPAERKLQHWEGLGSSWASLGASWECLRASGEVLRASWEDPEVSWEGLRDRREARGDFALSRGKNIESAQ